MNYYSFDTEYLFMDRKMKTENFSKRLEAIKDLLSKELVSDQLTLVNLLAERYEIYTNQSIVSRDLRRLGVIKKERKGELFYELPTLDVNVQILKLAIINISYNEAIIVIHTQPGLAAFVGDYIDQNTDLEILGCVAGENTVFVTPKSIQDIKKVYHLICQKTQFKI